MTTGIKFLVPGEAKPKRAPQIARRGKFVKMYPHEETVQYESLVKMAFSNALDGMVSECSEEMEKEIRGFFPLKGALHIELTIYRAPQKSLSKKKLDLALRGELRPIQRPDCSNIAKAVEDGLNGLAFVDDGQVVELVVRKFFASSPHVVVDIRELSTTVRDA